MNIINKITGRNRVCENCLFFGQSSKYGFYCKGKLIKVKHRGLRARLCNQYAESEGWF